MLNIIEKRPSVNGRGRVLVECPDCDKQWEVRSDYPKTVDRCKECDYKIREGRNKFYENTWERHQYTKYKWRCEQLNRSFDLSESEFYNFIKAPCHYCGNEYHNGIDRIDSSRGYEKDNIVPCCPICNTMKMDMSYNEFIAHIRRINKHVAEL